MGCLLQCPWHGAVFDARTGQVRRGPARKPLRTYPVEIADGAVLIAAERTADVP
jgi:3-phenylpropionate/trans-cinnamate dioxygenase ferredoxin subunit